MEENSMILKVRKKPLAVEAIQFTGRQANIEKLFDWSKGQVWLKIPGVLYVQCLEALAETPVGSYVIKGVKGEVWPVREDIFNETYEILHNYGDDCICGENEGCGICEHDGPWATGWKERSGAQ